MPEGMTNNARRGKSSDQLYVKNTLCKAAMEFMKHFRFLRIEEEDPIVKQSALLRDIMYQRKIVRDIFNSLRCSKGFKIFADLDQAEEEDVLGQEQDGFWKRKAGLKDFKNLVLKDFYLSFEQLQNLHMVEIKLFELRERLLAHID
mmetsp:Transcript_31126/g.47574  ORF Transcript_31126/g.47574 Transcript_31126/m.47574 type:complete len:146 (+) Transcript_31126:3770-4207(+)